MQSTNAAAGKTAVEKVGEKLAEKRRALGRGLESLLPGPRVVPGGVPPSSGREQGAPATAGGAPALQEPARQEQAVPENGVSLQAAASGTTAPLTDVQQLPLHLVRDNPNQTRMNFDKETLQELADSIAVQGVLQPIVVRPAGDGNYILIIGERRLRASRMAGRTTIPAIVKRVSEQQAAEMTIIENLQRQDLGCMEQANAFSNLSLHFNLTQEEIGKRVGVSRESVSNYMRLLKLPGIVIRQIQENRLSYSHARLLLKLGDEHELIAAAAQKAIMDGMSVQQLEAEIERVSAPGFVYGQKQPPQPRGAQWVDPNVKAAERSIEMVLGMHVRIKDRKGKGKITIEYGSLEDFDRVVGMLKGK